jgi:hypothetical protein
LKQHQVRPIDTHRDGFRKPGDSVRFHKRVHDAGSSRDRPRFVDVECRAMRDLGHRLGHERRQAGEVCGRRSSAIAAS